MSLLFLASCIKAQAPTVSWDKFYPGDYVLVGSRKISAANGYSEVMLLRVDQEA